jgi:hypothetical protein
MILVDTSALIDYLRGSETQGSRQMALVLERGIPFGISDFVYLEVLQGCRSEKDYTTLKRYLDTQTFYGLKRGRESFAEAARMYWVLRQRGARVSSTLDCLIARTAMENNLFLLHNDEDFIRIGQYFPLKLWEKTV